MKILYIIYQICFALPILLVLTILTALVTIIGSLINDSGRHYPDRNRCENLNRTSWTFRMIRVEQ